MTSRYQPHLPASCLLVCVILTSSILQSLGGTGSLTDSKVEAPPQNQPTARLHASKLLRRTRSPSLPSPLSSLLSPSDIEILSDLPHSTWLLDMIPTDSGRGRLSRYQSLDNEVLHQDIPDVNPHRVRPNLLKARALRSRQKANSVLGLIKMMIKKKQKQEIGEALRRRHKLEARLRETADDLALAQLTRSAIGDEETESRFEGVKQSRPDFLEIEPTHGHGSRNWLEKGFDQSGFRMPPAEKTHSFAENLHARDDELGFSRFEKANRIPVDLDLISPDWVSESEELNPRWSDGPDEGTGLSVFLGDQMGSRTTDTSFPVDVSYLDPSGFSEKFVSELNPDFPGGKFDGMFNTKSTSHVDASGSRVVNGRGDHSATGFWDSGRFVNENKDCHDIATKSCLGDWDCSCHGFYACHQGRCDLIGSVGKSEGGQRTLDDEVWSSDPVDLDSLGRGSYGQFKVDEAWDHQPVDFISPPETREHISWAPGQVVRADQVGSLRAR